ncbi:MAG: SH3 domain-containing protein [Sphingomonas sp.]
MRGDLADVRLAEQVFAPHYAAPMPTTAVRDTVLYADRGLTDKRADLAAGARFDVLELAGSHAWGLAAAQGLAGYVDRTALDRADLDREDFDRVDRA